VVIRKLRGEIAPQEQGRIDVTSFQMETDQGFSHADSIEHCVTGASGGQMASKDGKVDVEDVGPTLPPNPEIPYVNSIVPSPSHSQFSRQKHLPDPG
jgi:hypothetical protein